MPRRQQIVGGTTTKQISHNLLMEVPKRWKTEMPLIRPEPSKQSCSFPIIETLDSRFDLRARLSNPSNSSRDLPMPWLSQVLKGDPLQPISVNATFDASTTSFCCGRQPTVRFGKGADLAGYEVVLLSCSKGYVERRLGRLKGGANLL